MCADSSRIKYSGVYNELLHMKRHGEEGSKDHCMHMTTRKHNKWIKKVETKWETYVLVNPWLVTSP